MVAAQNGNSLAYHRLLSQVAVRLRAYYARRLPQAMIDDIIQEVLVAIHLKRHTYDPSRSFEIWLMAIARYKWIDMLRSLKAKAAEALALVLWLSAVGLLELARFPGSQYSAPILLFAPLPLLIWAAVRFGARAAGAPRSCLVHCQRGAY